MPSIFLAPCSLEVAEELLRFERDNRSFFEQHVNARPGNYYSLPGINSAIELAQREAREDRGYQYLIRSETGNLLGRVNLRNVRRAHFHSAELGYRIGESACGMGYATEAVRHVLRYAFGAAAMALHSRTR